MKSLIITQEKYTPYISFNTDTNIFDIAGESYSEDAFVFYQALLKWLSDYLKVNQRPITLNFRLLYFNTSSSQAIFHILEMLEDYAERENVDVQVNWYAKPNDSSMMEDGLYYQDNFDALSFNMQAL
ncbi:DUF1987 domain-containing protein [Microscilla marina]|uniref:SiaC family regulatory phosphoprotein domain-containing protein n=1 Tax=Microscilla marina ATCC 23134 TaxID=313606 RepID=A1ZZE6_MICM2|nr:DUF1987 domain-containing protein [Microscilla marina]EAY24245.1 conserved hypothetical protein [Microscilla marina ATCC 23134]